MISPSYRSILLLVLLLTLASSKTTSETVIVADNITKTETTNSTTISTPANTPAIPNNDDKYTSVNEAPYPDQDANLNDSLNVSSSSASVSMASTPDPEVDDEQSKSTDILVILLVLTICIICIHYMNVYNLHFLPESCVSVFIGFLIGLLFKICETIGWGSVKQHESFAPTLFFLVLLPPIILESGYSMHKWNFFHNIGSIVVYAVFGTIISATIVGLGIWGFGVFGVIIKLTATQSFAFGSLISAVDPVATLAIFHALDVNPLLNMLVFGESVLNDAVSIVLTKTVIEFAEIGPETSTFLALLQAIGYFLLLFFGSAAIGILIGLFTAVLLKYVNLRKTPSLEFSILIILAYAPYIVAESCQLSGIMAILFGGITMSHYAHPNLSDAGKLTVDTTLRTISFMAETCVFAYLGLAIFSFSHVFHASFIIWSIVFILFGRAANIFPLSLALNLFRQNKITPRMQFIMFYSGLRGAIAFALSLHLNQVAAFSSESSQVTQTIVTTTLVIVLVTIIVFGGSTGILLKFLLKPKNADKKVTLSKAEDWYLKELATSKTEKIDAGKTTAMAGFVKLDYKYLTPFFVRKSELESRSVSIAQAKSKELFDIENNTSDEEINATVLSNTA